MKRILFLLIICIITGCTGNPYKKNYESWKIYQEKPLEKTGEIDIKRVETVLKGLSVEEFLDEAFKDGYGGLGYSVFRSEDISEKKIENFAKEIGANLVVYSKKYLGEHSYQTVEGIPVYTNVYTHGIAYNPNVGNVYYSGSQLVSSTQYVPVIKTIYLYQYESVFLKKLSDEEIGYGMNIEDIEDVRKNFKIDKNISEGVVITSVVRGSQAYKDGFLRGDIIRKIGKRKVINYFTLEEIGFFSKGEDLVCEVLRNGSLKRLKVKRF